MVVRGAFGVQAPTRPAISLGPFLSLLATAFAPIVFSLVFPNYLYILDSPKAHAKWAQRLCFRCRNLLFANPAVKSIRCNIQHSRNFDRRVSLRPQHSGTHP